MKEADQAFSPQALFRPFLGMENKMVQRVRRYVAHRNEIVDPHAARCCFTPQHAAGFIWQPAKRVLGYLPSAQGAEPNFLPGILRFCQP